MDVDDALSPKEQKKLQKAQAKEAKVARKQEKRAEKDAKRAAKAARRQSADQALNGVSHFTTQVNNGGDTDGGFKPAKPVVTGLVWGSEDRYSVLEETASEAQALSVGAVGAGLDRADASAAAVAEFLGSDPRSRLDSLCATPQRAPPPSSEAAGETPAAIDTGLAQWVVVGKGSEAAPEVTEGAAAAAVARAGDAVPEQGAAAAAVAGTHKPNLLALSPLSSALKQKQHRAGQYDGDSALVSARCKLNDGIISEEEFRHIASTHNRGRLYETMGEGELEGTVAAAGCREKLKLFEIEDPAPVAIAKHKLLAGAISHDEYDHIHRVQKDASKH